MARVICLVALRKMTRYNATRGGPFHFHAPSRIFYKTARGAVGRLSHEVRWKYWNVAARLEERKVKGAAYHARRKAARRRLSDAI
ncbi:hypothetical protein BJ875DRAFT_153729 [Amylocarpus encephaloides]|uniref:Uncharacterized protein n=1 Tax=Amylocarpus encephaloides TaxID=45428 RepID=A0A9P7YAW0_9HELO|nr:hypothetical protein BJ875DRAFT_153729 [Amylocarpus encephaloides]